MQRKISRRSFLGSAAALGVGAAAFGLAGCSSDAKEAQPAWMPAQWDYETDIAVVGFGGAGGAAAATICSEELGEVLVLEAAPEGSEGGNTRVSGNLMFIPEDAEKAVKYQSALNAEYVVEDELIHAWAEAIIENLEWVESLGGDMQQSKLFSPEFPELEGSDACRTFCVDGKFSEPLLWQVLKDKEQEYGYPVLYETRAQELVFNPETKEVLGVKAVDSSGGEVLIKARKGVILSCGGFENNPEMMQTYCEVGRYSVLPLGTPYNRGDGFSMIAPLGAKLWHMNNMAGNGLDYVRSCGYDSVSISKLKPSLKSFIYVAGDGKRFMYEEKHGLNRHGKIQEHGVWISIPTPNPSWCIFDQKNFDANCIVNISPSAGGYANHNELYVAEDNEGFLEKGIIFKGDTVEELAEKISVNPADLAKTINDYNAYCANGKDEEYGRGEEVHDSFNMDKNVSQSVAEDEGSVAVEAFDLVALEGPFYAIELSPKILNTQGGPKRSAKGEVLDVNENPIPRLYAAGEFGTIYGYMYNGGGNVSEAIATGRLAARSVSALDSWDGANV